MLVAVGARAGQPDRVSGFDAYYPAVSAPMAILVGGGVTAANAGTIRSNAPLLVGIGSGAVVPNALGYGVGFLVTRRAP